MIGIPEHLLTTRRRHFALAIWGLIISSVGLLGNDAAFAAAAQLVKDIAPPEQRVPARLLTIQPVGHQKVLLRYITNVQSLSVNETWVFDRASGESSRFYNDDALRPLSSGAYKTSGANMLPEDVLFFALGPESTQSGLWKTDGTAEGTMQIHDLGGRNVVHYRFADTGGSLYFYTGVDLANAQLWRSDGTTAGTQPIKIIPWPVFPYFSWPEWSAIVNGTVYFLAKAPDAGLQLWKSDGTPDGTIPVKTIVPEQGASALVLMSAGSKVYFSVPQSDCSGGACTWSSSVLWVSDGTDAGTQPIKAFTGDSGGLGTAYHGLVLNGEILFNAYDAENGSKLWKSDGTVAGTVIVGPDADAPVIFRDALYSGFTQRYPEVAEGNASVPSVGPTSGIFERKVVGDKLFVADWDGTLWVSDGTASGVQRLINAPDMGGDKIEAITDVNGTAFFSVSNWRTDFSQLWSSDSTIAGTVRLGAGGPAGSSHPSRLVGSNSYVAFKAFDEKGNRTLWLSDGTRAGTTLLPRTRTDALPVYETPLAAVGGRTLFVVNDFDEMGGALWSTTGIASETSPLGVDVQHTGRNAEHVVFKDALYFSGHIAGTTESQQSRSGLWRSDGTAAGTSLILEDSENGLFLPHDFVPAGEILFFTNDDNELWVTDGTTEGTKLVLSFAESTIGGFYSRSVAVGRTLYFAVKTDRGGYALWRSDGTPEGTAQVYDFPPEGFAYIGGMTVVDERIYLTVWDAAGEGHLWQSDGTPQGTAATDISSPNSLLAALDGSLLFSQANPNGGGSILVELDTKEGALGEVRSLRAFRTISSDSIIAVGSVVYFTADDGIHGIELWMTDGTPEGTVMVQDIAPGAVSSRPAGLVLSQSKLFFSADEAANGRELWTLPLDGTSGKPEQASGGGGGATSGTALLVFASLLSFRRRGKRFF